LIFVDDGSTDGTVAYVNELRERYGPSRFYYHRHPNNLGTNAAWSTGIRIAAALGASYVAIVNNDVLYTSGWEQPLLEALERDFRLAVVSPMSTEGRMPVDWPAGSGRHYNPAGYQGYLPILGACFMCRMSLFDEIGLFPPELKVFFGDNWIVLASQHAGYECGYAKDSYIHHLFCQTTARIDQRPLWQHDSPAFEAIAAKLGTMRPYLLRGGQRAEDLPVTGVK
jgi:GT2 family glycosyltransferase